MYVTGFKTILDVMGLGVLVKKPRRKATTSQATARTNNDQILEVELCKMPAADLVTAQQSADKGEGKEKADWQVSTVWVRNCLGLELPSHHVKGLLT